MCKYTKKIPSDVKKKNQQSKINLHFQRFTFKKEVQITSKICTEFAQEISKKTENKVKNGQNQRTK